MEFRLVSGLGSSQPKSDMGETIYLKIACPTCTGHIEFPAEMRGQIINCPHCSLSMALDLRSGPSETPPPGNLYQRLRALNNVNSPPVPINLPEGFRPQSEGLA